MYRNKFLWSLQCSKNVKKQNKDVQKCFTFNSSQIRREKKCLESFS